MHPWHDIDLYPESPSMVPAVIEIPKSSEIKYEIDLKTGILTAERILPADIKWPANYGFIPQTYCADEDPMDIFVLSQKAVPSLCLVRARPIGVMKIVDNGDIDDKIIAVDQGDNIFSAYRHIDELPTEILKILYRFFDDYRSILKKEITCNGFLGPTEARALIEQAAHMYQLNKNNLPDYRK